jgi:CBS domain-containing protein
MKVQDVMTEQVKTCSPDTNLAEAAAMMWENDCVLIPVVGDGGKAIGVITDRDIAIAVGTRNKIASDVPVKEVMSTTLYTASPEDDIHTALKLMRKEELNRLPVVNKDGVLKGILSLNVVALKALHADGKNTPGLNYEDVVSTLKAVCEHGHPKVVKELHYTAAP